MLLNVMLRLPYGPVHTAPEIPMLPCSGQDRGATPPETPVGHQAHACP